MLWPFHLAKKGLEKGLFFDHHRWFSERSGETMACYTHFGSTVGFTIGFTHSWGSPFQAASQGLSQVSVLEDSAPPSLDFG